MKKTLLFILAVVGIFTFYGKSNACNVNTAKHLAKAYVLAQPLSTGNLDSFLQNNRQMFQENGSAIQCAKRLGEYLRSNGLRSYDTHAYERVVEIAPPELVEKAPQVAQSINAGSIDAINIGNELLWLSEVLPSATRGNYSPFNNTGTLLRQQIRQYMGIIGPILQENRSLIDLMNNSLINPLLEDQIMMLALMLPD